MRTKTQWQPGNLDPVVREATAERVTHPELVRVTHPYLLPSITPFPPPRVVSLLRWSKDEMEWTRSETRQFNLAKRYTEKMGVEIDTELRLSGISAADGDHREPDTDFGEFLEELKYGTSIPWGTWLIIESLDRITRENAAKAAGQLYDMVHDYGIEIHVIMPGEERIYNKSNIDDVRVLTDLLDELLAIFKENSKKRRRILQTMDDVRWEAIVNKWPMPGEHRCWWWMKIVGQVKSSSNTKYNPGKFVLLTDPIEPVREFTDSRGNTFILTPSSIAVMVALDREIRTAYEERDYLTQNLIPCPAPKGMWTVGVIETLWATRAIFGYKSFFVEVREPRDVKNKKTGVVRRVQNKKVKILLQEVPGYYREGTAIHDPTGAIERRLDAESAKRGCSDGKVPGAERRFNALRDIGICGECGQPLHSDRNTWTTGGPSKRTGKPISDWWRPVIDGAGREHLSRKRCAAYYELNEATINRWVEDGYEGFRWGERAPPEKHITHKLRCGALYNSDTCDNTATYDEAILLEQLFEIVIIPKLWEPQQNQKIDKAALAARIREIDAALEKNGATQTRMIHDLYVSNNENARPVLDGLMAAANDLLAEKLVCEKAMTVTGRTPEMTLDHLCKTYEAMKAADEIELPDLQRRLNRDLKDIVEFVALTEDGQIICRLVKKREGENIDIILPEPRRGWQKERLLVNDTERVDRDVPSIIRDALTVFGELPPAEHGRIRGHELCARLMKMAYRPWLRGTKWCLENVLRPYGVIPKAIRWPEEIDGTRDDYIERGYCIEQFQKVEAKMNGNSTIR